MRSIALILSLLSSAAVFSQAPGANAVAVLQKVSLKLDGLSSLNYNYVREMRYYADNYHAKDSAAMHVEFLPELPLGMRFQAKRERSLFIYDGKMTINLDHKNMTIDSARITSVKKLESNSFLYNSMVSLRNNIPLIIANDSISKSLSDTIVDGRELRALHIEGAGMYLNSLKGINYFNDTGLRRPYILLIDKRTMLPYQLIAKIVKGSDDRDFIKITYMNVKEPAINPVSASWAYASYQSKYQPFKPPVKIAVVKPGTPLPFFTYPIYNPSRIDSLSSTEMKGKVVLLEFWFKSCGPCMMAMPHYNALQEKFKKDGFELLTVNIEDPIEDIAFFYNKYPPNYKMLFNGHQLFESLGFSGCPSSLLVDRNGRAAKTFFGFNQKEVEASIADLLKAN